MAALRRNRAASRVAAAWRGRKERRAYELLRTNAVTIQKVQRRRAAAVLYEKMANEAREQAKLENRLAAMEAKLRDAQSKNEEEEGALVANALVDLRSANADLRKENEKLRSESAALKKRSQNWSRLIRADVLAASRVTLRGTA